jgi:hypothetical protein
MPCEPEEETRLLTFAVFALLPLAAWGEVTCPTFSNQ